MKKNAFRKLTTAFFLSFLSYCAKASAQGGGVGVGTGGLSIKNPLGTENIITLISRVLDYLIYISVPILALMILIGGFQILTARGESKQIIDGRKTITWAVVGFLLILISKGIALILLTIMKP